mmetsp:Transcript_9211/g.30535  ORF Transcript_9211/g.30535 Transcript_9211/m.30535 type:complete len:219 (-) Transcript_9211:240-896(-)
MRVHRRAGRTPLATRRPASSAPRRRPPARAWQRPGRLPQLRQPPRLCPPAPPSRGAAPRSLPAPPQAQRSPTRARGCEWGARLSLLMASAAANHSACLVMIPSSAPLMVIRPTPYRHGSDGCAPALCSSRPSPLRMKSSPPPRSQVTAASAPLRTAKVVTATLVKLLLDGVSGRTKSPAPTSSVATSAQPSEEEAGSPLSCTVALAVCCCNSPCRVSF